MPSTGRKWWRKPLPALDLESTGLDPYSASIVQLGLCAVTPAGKTVGKVMGDILRPAVPVEDGAAKVHGISQTRAEREGKNPHAYLFTVSSRISKAASKGYPLVIFNATYDLPLLFTDLERHEIPKPWGMKIVDPLIMAQKALGRRGGTRLHTLATRYGIGEQDSLHDAVQDCRLAVGVMHGLLKEFPYLRMPLNELHDSQRKWALKRDKWPWGKYDRPTPQLGFM